MKCVHRSTQSHSPKYLSERNRCQPDAKKINNMSEINSSQSVVPVSDRRQPK